MIKKYLIGALLFYITVALVLSCKKSDDEVIVNNKEQIVVEDTIAWPIKGWFFIGEADGEGINYQTIKRSFDRGIYDNGKIHVMKPRLSSDYAFAREFEINDVVRFSWSPTYGGFGGFNDTNTFISPFIARKKTEVEYNFLDTASYWPSRIHTHTVYQFSESFTRVADGKQIQIKGTFGTITW